MSIAAAVRCPRCSGDVTAPEGVEPWCGGCEWNLDRVPDVDGVGWVRRRMYRLDAEAGFRADRDLIAQDAGRRPQGGFRLLVAVSVALLVAMIGSLVAGVVIVAGGGGAPRVVGGLLLILFAWMLRPRFGRLRSLLKHRWKLPVSHAPELNRLIDRVAEATGMPKPDLVTVDLDWNAAAAVVGFRRTRVLVLGAPLLLALTPQQMVALIGHELAHFRYDGDRGYLTRPAETVFGAISQALRPPPGDALDRGFEGLFALAYTLLQLVFGSLSLAFYAVHLALNVVAARDGRRAELRADGAAVKVAGTAATLELIDTLALLPELRKYVQHWVPEDDPGGHWRQRMATVRARELPTAPLLRQLSIRTGASLWASHPAPGRRHDWLTRQPREWPAVTVDDEGGAAIDRELRPYAQELHRVLAGRELI